MTVEFGDTGHDDAPWELTRRLMTVGRAVRDAVRNEIDTARDGKVLRHAGGDDVFGVDSRADRTLRDAMVALGTTWSGSMVCEGFDDPLPIGDGTGNWRFLVDPVDGTRGFLAGKRSAWVLIGAGRDATTLEDLEIGVAVEIPGRRAARGLVAGAVRGGGVEAFDDDLISLADERTPVVLRPSRVIELDRCFVTVVRLLPGAHGPIGSFADRVLDGFEVYDDLAPCTGGQLMAIASGTEAAVLDPRPEFGHRLCAHPYDLAALVVAREAGVIVEGLRGGPLDVPIDTDTDVAWAGYANAAIADILRPRVAAALG